MRNFLFAGAAAFALIWTGAPAMAAPVPGNAALADIAAAHSDIVKAQARHYRGHRYCFYTRGWRGPGWYRCGYSNRRGYGWGGAHGWRGWHHPGWRSHGYDRRHERRDRRHHRRH